MQKNPYDDVPHDGIEVAEFTEYFRYFVNAAAETIVEAYETRIELNKIYTAK